MLKLSNKERYAIQALFDLAFHHDGQPAQVKDIAVRQRIPLRFLEQIFQDLKRAGLVGSKRGPRGGYRLARDPQKICVGDVLRATSGRWMDPPAAGVAKRETPGGRRVQGARGGGATPYLGDVTEAVLRDLGRDIEQCFDAVTLEHGCELGERLGVRRRARGLTSYAI